MDTPKTYVQYNTGIVHQNFRPFVLLFDVIDLLDCTEVLNLSDSLTRLFTQESTDTSISSGVRLYIQGQWIKSEISVSSHLRFRLSGFSSLLKLHLPSPVSEVYTKKAHTEQERI
jgi:hypothetical protein